jgi:hypothetical protein
VVPGTLALLFYAATSARTHDVFASNGGDSGSSTPAVYQDSFSNSCDKSSNSSLNVDGYNPAICDKVTGVSGQECLSNPAETGYVLVKKQGNVCYYCEQPVPPGKYRVIVPEDIATAVYQQAKGNLYCGRTAADPCYWECRGNVPPVIPTAGVTPMPPAEYGATGGTPPPPSGGNQPPIKPPAVLEQQVPSKTKLKGTITANVTACPSLFDLLRAPKFTSEEVTDLTNDVATAKATLVIANRYISQPKWTPATVALAEKYFGNASAETQATLRKNVKNVLATLIGIKTATSTIYPTGTEFLAPEVSDNCLAYVHDPKETIDERDLNKVFLCKAFFALPQTGPDSQPMVLVHEVSHLPGGASTRDYAYGTTDCGALVTFTTTDLGKLGAWISQEKLTPKSPKLVDLTDKAPLDNADSFKYFVYDVANQETSK